MRSAPFFATVVLVFVAAFAASPAQARICTWTGDGDGVFWSDADNWEDGIGDPCVPGAGDIAIIGGAVEVDQSRTVGELQLFGGVTINATYTLTVNLLILDGGSLGGDGEVKVDGDAQIINGSMSVSVTLGAGGSFDCRVDMQIAAGQTVENNGTLFTNASAGCRILMGADATLINTGTIGPDVRIAADTNNTPWPVVENRLGATLRVDNTRYLGWLCICSIDQILIPGQGSDRLVGVASELFLDSLPESRERLVQVEREVILHVFPQPLNRVELWAVRRQKEQSNVLRNRQGFGLVKPPIV